MAIRHEIASGAFLTEAADMVEFLQEKFHDKSNPLYVIKNIDPSRLELARVEDMSKVFPTIDGSQIFQVVVFKPNQMTFKASPFLCLCKICQNKYGECSNFQEYQLVSNTLNTVSLRSNFESSSVEKEEKSEITDFLCHNSFCAVAAAYSSKDTMWFIIQITALKQNNETVIDDYNNTIATGHYLEEIYSNKRGMIFKMSKKTVYFYKESVVYPFVQVKEEKKGHFLIIDDYVYILNYAENTRALVHLKAFIKHYSHIVLFLFIVVYFL